MGVERRGGGGLSRGNRSVLAAALAAYALVLGGLSVHRYRTFHAGMYDLGIMEQIFWNTSHGRILTESVNMAEPISRTWSGRWEAIYLPIAALHRVFPYPATALILQTLWLALGAIPLYLLAADRLGKGALALAFPLAYLLYPPLHNANLFDIHGITLATPMILFAFHALDRRSTGRFLLFCVLLILCREDAVFAAFMLGLYAAVVARERKAGAAVMAAGAAWFLFTQNFHLLRPLLGLPPVNDPNVFPSRWEGVGGGSPGAFFLSVVRDPLGFLALFTDGANARLLVKLFAPVGFLSLFSPASLAILVPNLSINMIGTSAMAKNIYHHYTGAVTPVVFISAVLGTGNLLSLLARRRGGAASCPLSRWIGRRTIAAAILAASATSAVLWSRVPAVAALQAPPHRDAIEAVIAEIPDGASLSAHFHLGAHAAHREELYLFPDRVGDVDLVLYDLDLPFTRLMSHTSNANPAAPPDNEAFRGLLDDPRYGVVVAREGTVLFRRGADHAEGLRRLGTRERSGGDPVGPVDFGAVSLEAVRGEGVVGFPEKYVHFGLDWRWRGGDPAPGFAVTLVIAGEGGERAFRHSPFFGRLGGVAWEPGDPIRDDAYLPIAGLAAGKYTLRLRRAAEDGTVDRGLVELLIPEEAPHE